MKTLNINVSSSYHTFLNLLNYIILKILFLPGYSLLTKNALIPLCFLALSVVANTTDALASWALVIHDLVPFKTQFEPLLTAIVEAAPASLPLP